MINSTSKPACAKRYPVWLLTCALALVLNACGGGDPVSNTGSDDQSADNNVATDGNNSNQATGDNGDTGNADGDTEPVPPPVAPVDQEPPPDPALGASTLLRVSDTQRIAYTDTPPADGNPLASVVLLLHDFGGSSVHWNGLTSRLSNRHRVIAMDMRGHGNSTRTGCCTRFDALADDVLTLLNALNVDVVDLVGAGGGALLAQKLATTAPERTHRLVLIASPATGGNNNTINQWIEQLGQQAATAGPDNAFLDAYNSPGPQLTPQGELGLAGLRIAQRATATDTWVNALELVQNANFDGVLPGIASPVMLLTGDSDQVTSPQATTRLANTLRTEVTVSVADAGRYPGVEQPEVAADLILKFLSPRGTLHGGRLVSEITRGAVDNLGDGFLQEVLVREVTGEPACSIRWYEIEYQTTGAAGESTNATAGVAIPYGDPRFCSGERPVVLYAHGTSADRNYNTISSSEVGVVVSSTVATHGNIIVAPDYAGYGRSWLDYHPYLNAQANAADMIDALRAARRFIAGLDDISTGPLYISGYSQGGYVAMATHREIERFHSNEFTVRASLPMSGPYALGNTVQTVLGGRVSDGASQLLPFFTEGYQRAYGNIYANPDELFNPPYDQTAIGLFPGNVSSGATIEQGLLPANTIAAQGNPHLLRQEFVDNYLANPQNALRQAVERNSLINDWTPAAPMQLCGSNKDTVVFYDNTIDAVNAFASRGFNVRYYDFNRARTFDNNEFDRRYLTFRTLILFADDSEYHVAVAPFCLALVRAYISDDSP